MIRKTHEKDPPPAQKKGLERAEKSKIIVLNTSCKNHFRYEGEKS